MSIKEALRRFSTRPGELFIPTEEIAGTVPLKLYQNENIAHESVVIQVFGTRHHEACARNGYADILDALQTENTDLIGRWAGKHLKKSPQALT